MPLVAGMNAKENATPGAPRSDATGHRPVLLKPLIESLQPPSGGTAIDATFGGGSVTAALLETVGESGIVLAIDRDISAIENGTKRFSQASNLHLVHGNFGDLESIARSQGIQSADAIAFDLGVSSMQLDIAERGFSFMREGPLDMRMDPSEETETAADIVNSWDAQDLENLIFSYGEERWARLIARNIVERRQNERLETTAQLRKLVESTIPHKAWPKQIHPATRTFQALRIQVNHEMESLESGLQAAITLLRPGGRLGVISFHSLEDTLAKNTLHVAAQNCICPPQQPHCTCAHRATLFSVTKKPIRPTPDEISDNPRSRSARLRVAEKLQPTME